MASAMGDFPVRDAFGRDRTLGAGLTDEGTDVLLISPTGEGVVVDPAQVPLLIERLIYLQTLAFANRTGRRPS